MSVKAMLVRLMLCLCGVLAVSSVYAESVIIATPQQGVGVTVDVFDRPDASSGTPSSTSTVPFRPQAFYIPSVQSFKGKMYLFWANSNDRTRINFATSAEGKSWSPVQAIRVDDVSSDVSVSVFKEKLVLTFANANNQLKTLSSENGAAWSTVKSIATGHSALNNKPIVYNGKLFVLYSGNSGDAIYYVTSDDGLVWGRENLAFQESPDKILTMVPVVYNGQLWAYYAFENGAMFARTYDRAGQWGAKQALTGITSQGPRGFLNSATMIGERVFISSSSNTFYSNDGLHWNTYFSKRFPGSSAYPSGLGVSYAMTAND